MNEIKPIPKEGGSLVESPPFSGVYQCTNKGGCGWRGIPNNIGGKVRSYDPPRRYFNFKQAPEVKRVIGAKKSTYCLNCETEDITEIWLAMNAEPRKTKKVGRNEPCICGSGKKYKKCCG